MTQQSNLKIPPHDLDAEQAVLGAININPKDLPKIQQRLKPDDFYREAHGIIYKTMIALQDPEKINFISICNHLKESNLLEKAGGQEYIFSVFESVSSSAGWPHWAEIIKKASLKRQIIALCGTARESAFYDWQSPEDIIAQLDQFVLSQYNNSISNDFIPLKSVLDESFKNIEKACETEGSITGLKTGFIDLDNITAGLQPADLIILAGRPSMGKTAFALNLALNVALSDKSVAVISIEMARAQLGNRLISSESHVSAQRLRTGILGGSDWSKITKAAGSLSDLKIFIDDTSDISINQIKYKCRKLQKEHGLDFIIVDYLQLMQATKGENRNLELANISRGLKGIAKTFNVPVLALSQLSRKLEERSNKRPILSDLRESGAIEQDADVVAFIYRDEVYHKTTDENRNIAEIIIGKQRNGPIGFFKLTFQKESMRFENYIDNNADYEWQNRKDC